MTYFKPNILPKKKIYQHWIKKNCGAFSGGRNNQKWDFFKLKFLIFPAFFIFEVDFLPPLIFFELNIVIFGNIIFKCPSVSEKMTYFTAHMGHSGMSTKLKLFSSHSKTPCRSRVSGRWVGGVCVK